MHFISAITIAVLVLMPWRSTAASESDKMNCTQQTALISEYVTLAKALRKSPPPKSECVSAQNQWKQAHKICSEVKCKPGTPYERSDCDMCQSYKEQCLKFAAEPPKCSDTKAAQNDEDESEPVLKEEREPASRQFGSF